MQTSKHQELTVATYDKLDTQIGAAGWLDRGGLLSQADSQCDDTMVLAGVCQLSLGEVQPPVVGDELVGVQVCAQEISAWTLEPRITGV